MNQKRKQAHSMAGESGSESAMLNQESDSFAAFISYRRFGDDARVAKRLQRLLEEFRVPKQITAPGTRDSLGRVFRDDTGMPAGQIREPLQDALRRSSHLIVVCSTSTPDSEWVNWEVGYYLKMHGADRVLPILLNGTPDTSYPAALQTGRHGQPPDSYRPVDIRSRPSWRAIHELDIQFVELVARILGCDRDLLDDHRVRELARRRNRRVRWSIISLVCLVALLCLVAIDAARANHFNALSRQSQPLVAAIMPFLLGASVAGEVVTGSDADDGGDWFSQWIMDPEDFQNDLTRVYADRATDTVGLLAWRGEALREYRYHQDAEVPNRISVEARGKHETYPAIRYALDLQSTNRSLRDYPGYDVVEQRKLEGISRGRCGSVALRFDKRSVRYPCLGFRFTTPLGQFEAYYLEQQAELDRAGVLSFLTVLVDQHLDLQNVRALRRPSSLPSIYVVPVGARLKLKPVVVGFTTRFVSVEVTSIKRAAAYLGKSDLRINYPEDSDKLTHRAQQMIARDWRPSITEFVAAGFLDYAGQIHRMGVRPWFVVEERVDTVPESAIRSLVVQEMNETVRHEEASSSGDHWVSWRVFGGRLPDGPPASRDSFSLTLEGALASSLVLEQPGSYYVTVSLSGSEVRWRVLAVASDEFDSAVGRREFQIRQYKDRASFRIRDLHAGHLSNYIRDWRLVFTIDGREFLAPGHGEISLDLEKLGIVPPGEHAVTIDVLLYDPNDGMWRSVERYDSSLALYAALG